MSPPPLVTVAIPAYNPRYFAEAFASARAQSYDALEILVSDDSPGTEIAAIVRAAGDARVRCVRNVPSLGFHGNFTQCWRLARGEYLKFLNDDDCLRPDCVSLLVEAFRRHPGLALATSRREVIDAGGAPRPNVGAAQLVSLATCLIEGCELGNLVLMNMLNLIGEPSTVLFRRADVEPEGGSLFRWSGVDFHCYADLALWLRLLARGSAYYHAAALSQYRVHPGQEQRRGEVAISCLRERIPLVRRARAAGFLSEPGQHRHVLARIAAIAEAWKAQLPEGSEIARVAASHLAEVARETAAVVAAGG